MLLSVNGISYEVFVPVTIMKTLDSNMEEDREVKFITYHYHHAEPSKSIPVLIGFSNEVEREFFEKFITVSGVGPKAAVKALTLPISNIAKAIDEADMGLLTSLPGIGRQRAKEIIAKLQGKVGKYGLIQDKHTSELPATKGDFQEEALEVLLQLQYKRNEAEKMLERALERSPDAKSAEELLNEVYRQREIK